jgi:sigma-B regulation protein RsbU (phosphoserine phosphatase)
MLLGVLPDEKWEKRTIQIFHGDGLLLYTDGVTEGFNEQGELYGHNRLKKAMHEITCTSAQTICSTISQDLERFVGAEAQSDDIAMIVMKRENE